MTKQPVSQDTSQPKTATTLPLKDAPHLAHLFLFGVVIFAFIGLRFLSGMPKRASFGEWVYALYALLGHSAMLALFPALLVGLLSMGLNLLSNHFEQKLPRFKVFQDAQIFTRFFAPLAYATLGFLIYVDTIIFKLYGFHFNPMIWNLLTTDGAGESWTMGTATIISVTFVGILIFALLISFSVFGINFLRRRKYIIPLKARRHWLKFVLVIFLGILGEKVIYGISDIRNNIGVLRTRNLYPFYQPLTFKRSLQRMGFKFTPSLEIPDLKKSDVDYPKTPLRLKAGGAEYNVVIVAIESGRFDMLTPQTMPFLSKWSEQYLRFDNHYSGGNCTRFGLFPLLYGIHGTYWHSFLAQRRRSEFLALLKSEGYKMGIFSSTSLTFPELKSTAFVEEQDNIWDTFPKGLFPHQRDTLTIKRFSKFVEKNTTNPFFSFLFLDGPHQMYSYPPERKIFPTNLDPNNINFTELAWRSNKNEVYVPLINRYKNSIHFLDSQLKQLVENLEKNNVLDKTILIFIGDHGEAFGEAGRFGHNSSFSKYQTKVLFTMHMPGALPARYTHLTSHVDIVPTVLSKLGCVNPLTDYTQGRVLTDTSPRQFVILSGWGTIGLVDSNSTTELSLEMFRGDSHVYDLNHNLLPNQAESLKEKIPSLGRAFSEITQFTE